MCGIAGFYNALVDPPAIRKVTEAIRHRGPDEQGVFTNGRTGLINTRLSIIELSSLGAQPYKYESLVLVYNGELYNYREIREDLKKKGYTFDSNSDSEVLIKAFHCWRQACVDRFIGMFAFCIYDEKQDALYIFRDRVGVKPLYYSVDANGGFFFASELKALRNFPVDRAVDPAAVLAYFRFGFVPSPLSIWKNTRKLEPGHFLVVDQNGITDHSYWKPGTYAIKHQAESEWLEELEALMISAFKYRMVSDVPVGVFLSGGIDSSLLCAILQKHSGNIHTFTVGFSDPSFDETPFALDVATRLKTERHHKVLELGAARKLLEGFYNIYDEPFADTSGIPTAFIASHAREEGMKVVLSADGGDELFGGYPHYQKVTRLYERISAMPSLVCDATRRATQSLLPRSRRAQWFAFNAEHKLYALEELLQRHGQAIPFFESCIANQTDEEIRRLTGIDNAYPPRATLPGTLLQNMMTWDFDNSLPDDLLVKVDRATMHVGVEARDPFLDHRLVELTRSMPDDLKIRHGKGKYILRKLLARYLPIQIFERTKQGFSIPVFDWFRTDLDNLFETYLVEERIREIPFLNPAEVLHEFRKYRYNKQRSRQYNIEKMWRILSFMLWWERYMTR